MSQCGKNNHLIYNINEVLDSSGCNLVCSFSMAIILRWFEMGFPYFPCLAINIDNKYSNWFKITIDVMIEAT